MTRKTLVECRKELQDLLGLSALNTEYLEAKRDLLEAKLPWLTKEEGKQLSALYELFRHGPHVLS